MNERALHHECIETTPLERLDGIFLEPHLEQRVARALLLLHDVLELVPEPYDVTRVRANVQQSLHDHGLGTPDVSKKEM